MDGSKDLQRQVLGYYKYLWIKQKGRSQPNVYGLLPTVFQAEVTHEAYKTLFQKASFESWPLAAIEFYDFTKALKFSHDFFCCHFIPRSGEVTHSCSVKI